MLDHPKRPTDVENGRAFHRRSARNRIGPSLVGAPGPTFRLGDVEGDGHRGTAQLIRQGGMTARQPIKKRHAQGDEVDGTAIYVEALESEHGAGSSAGS
jgi:hypothetical protein